MTYIGVFPSRSVAGVWWRAITEGEDPEAKENIRRVNAQFYIQKELGEVEKSLMNLKHQYLDCEFVRQSVFFELINGIGGYPFQLIPPDNGRDLISGR